MTADAAKLTSADKPETQRTGEASAGTTWNTQLYDDKHAFVWKYGESVLELLEPKPGERILDLGCGTGHLTAQIAKAGAEVVGIDQDPAMIEKARATYPELRFATADAREFTLEGLSDRPFDAVFSNAVLHWVRPPDAAARCIAAALRPGGRFVCEFGGRGNVRRIVEAVRRALAEFVGPGSERLIPDWYYPSIAEHTAVLERAGLETTSAALFPRLTPLKSAEGVRHWVTMFIAEGVGAMPEERREAFFASIEEELRGELLVDGVWHADYRRLRLTALRV